ncbi:MAG: hypothetical protein IPN29_19635 [Saprospiraceae bacterium]|nr:hypothetical protein [Saprospiraceae bacterium]
MGNKDLDKWIKEKLDGQLSDRSTPDWDVFSEILKKSDGFQNLDFDKSIKTKVEGHRNPFNENHWIQLKNRLVKEENLRKRLFSVKAVELIALLLLLLGFQFQEAKKIQQMDLEPIAASVNQHAHKEKVAGFTGPVAAIPYQDIDAYVHISKIFQSKNSLTAAPIENKVEVLVIPVVEVMQKVNLPHDHYELTALPLKHMGILHSPNYPLPEISDLLKPTPASNEKQTFLTPSFSAGVGITKSGFDPIYNLKSYSTYSSQFAGGVLFSIKKGTLETQTGIRYSRRTHKPASIVETYGDFLNNYFEISLDKISYDIVEVPLSLKFFFKENKNTSYFAKLGLNANLSLANHYTITNKPASLEPLGPPSVGYAEDNHKSSRAKLKDKDFNPGLLQNGTLSHNFFLTLSAEMGLEHKLSHRNALVLGAEFSKYYMIDGIGPNKDKLNGFSLNFGVKHLLN